MSYGKMLILVIRFAVKKIKTYWMIGLMAFAAGCSNPPDYPVEPVLKLVSLSRNVIYQNPTGSSPGDSVRVIFEFTDGDGDLGFENYQSESCNLCDTLDCYEHSTLSLFLFDNRQPGCLIPYNLPYIPPRGSSDAISGTIDLVISSICCIKNSFPCLPYPGQTDTVIYSVQIRDRAGNRSSRLELPPITIICN
ncbi:MAG: hypothetical protein KatS3mg031_2718 [Chitinophagales bacterium]|nr:MAG: hypothetical protein KatS3mg031_2718 [Chitinophagales bacterium]